MSSKIPRFGHGNGIKDAAADNLVYGRIEQLKLSRINAAEGKIVYRPAVSPALIQTLSSAVSSVPLNTSPRDIVYVVRVSESVHCATWPLAAPFANDEGGRRNGDGECRNGGGGGHK